MEQLNKKLKKGGRLILLALSFGLFMLGFGPLFLDLMLVESSMEMTPEPPPTILTTIVTDQPNRFDGTSPAFELSDPLTCPIPADGGQLPCHANFLRDRALVSPRANDTPLFNIPCRGGMADRYPCKDVDLIAFLPASNFGLQSLSDLWGWTDQTTGREYVLLGLEDGTVFLDISEPTLPRYLGKLPQYSEAERTYWRDIKVYQDHAYIVADFSGPQGMQIFDLRRLRTVTEPQTFTVDGHYQLVGSAHNLHIHAATGTAFIVGITSGQELCGRGMHMVDLTASLTAPIFAGCVSDDGYVHDTDCVIYHGPELEFHGRELCANFNEDSLTLVDVTDRSFPVQLSRTEYEGSRYTHQGEWMPDHRYLLLDDESDEELNGVKTTTYIWDLLDLENPIEIGAYTAQTAAIDHNQYERWGYSFQANYRAGLRILDLAEIKAGRLAEVAYFDIYPDDNRPLFNGAWTAYPYFDSGIIPLSGIEQGLFLLQPNRLKTDRYGPPDESRLTTAPGEPLLHTFKIPSPGPDLTYTVSLIPGLWDTELISPADGIFETSYFDAAEVTVRVAPGTEIGSSDRFTLTLDAQASPSPLPPLTMVGITEIDLRPVIGLNLLPLGSEPLHNGRVKRQVEVTNLGYVADQFTIEADTAGVEWPLTLATSETGRLGRGEAEIVEIEQHVGDGYFDRFTIQVGSVASSTISTTLEIDTEIEVSYQVDRESVLFLNGGRWVTHTIEMTNTGQISDSYRIILDQASLFDTVPAEIGPLGPGERSEIEVIVWMGQAERREHELEIRSVRNLNLGETAELRSYTNAPFSLYLPWQQGR